MYSKKKCSNSMFLIQACLSGEKNSSDEDYQNIKSVSLYMVRL